MNRLKSPIAAAIASAALTASVVGGVAIAQTNTPTVINACHDKANGNVRLVSSTSDCRANETFTSWNQKGEKGDTGPQGPQGPQGHPGTNGTDGAVGPAGPIGPLGPVGPIGATGPAGAVGPAGPIGPVGPAGPIGATGPAGAVGPQGAAGPVGPVGATGANGVSGWEQVFGTYVDVPKGSNAVATARCPSGKRPISGGFSSSIYGMSIQFLGIVFHNGTDQWGVSVQNATGSDGNIVAIAHCAIA